MAQARALPVWSCVCCLSGDLGIGLPPSPPPLTTAIPPPQDLAASLASSKSQLRLIKRIPKPVRTQVAIALAEALDVALERPSHNSWSAFLNFAYNNLKAPKDPSRTSGITISSAIRQQLNRAAPPSLFPDPSSNSSGLSLESAEKIAARVRSKCADGDIRAALRVLTSSDTFMPPSPNTIAALRSKHPEPNPNEVIPDFPVTECLTVTREEVMSAISSMPSGSSGGLDGVRPIHLQELLSQASVEGGTRLLTALTKLVNLFLAGKIPEYARAALFGASLCALKKPNGGVRPIAIGSVYRRVASRIAAQHATNRLAHELEPVQVGVGTPRGAESAIHAAREYLLHNLNSSDKIDVKNSFNTVNRSNVLTEIHNRCPEIFKIALQSYGSSSPLFYGTTQISSSTGVQQGDPLGPIGFALAVDRFAQQVAGCELNIWYLDDATQAGEAGQVIGALRSLKADLAEIGLELNPSKCEVSLLSDSPSVRSAVLGELSSFLPDIRETAVQDLVLLGSPLLDPGLPSAIEIAHTTIAKPCERIQHLDSHSALFFLTHHTSAPRLTYFLRTTTIFRHPELLLDIDNLISETTSKAVNVNLSSRSIMEQASLPVRHGGLGLRRLPDLALPCFIASLTSSLSLSRAICPSLPIADPPTLGEAIRTFSEVPGVNDLPADGTALHQRAWDDAACRAKRESLLDTANQLHRARLLAAADPHSGSWLHALPLPSLGLHLDDETVRVAVALRLGAPVCQPHRCRCGRQVDNLGHHGLSCRFSAGRLPRHANLNDVVKRSLAAAGVPSWLEPVGLDRGNGRRPDGLTVFPFSGGRSLCWDATCVDTFCATAIADTARRPGAAADAAEECKRRHYSGLEPGYRFEPVAVETSGTLGGGTLRFLQELGRRVTACTGERRETHWLLQRVSMAIVRGNAAAILATGRVA